MKFLLVISVICCVVALNVTMAQCCGTEKACPKEKAKGVIEAWDKAVTEVAAMTEEQKAENEKGMKIAMECPVFQASIATKMFMKKAIHANGHLYQILKASCEGCKDCKEGEMCKKCAEMMEKLPKEAKENVMARHTLVMTMAEVLEKVIESVKKIHPDPTCEFQKAIACDVKDLKGIKEEFTALTAEADKVIAMWKEAPDKFAALPEEKKAALKTLAEKMKDCPVYKAEQETCKFFGFAVDCLVKIDAACAKGCEGCCAGEMKDAYVASATMNVKMNELITTFHGIMEKMK